ncbi:hypothetical protein LINPERHAP2_LOCUS4062 [Linum perenne]
MQQPSESPPPTPPPSSRSTPLSPLGSPAKLAKKAKHDQGVAFIRGGRMNLDGSNSASSDVRKSFRDILSSSSQSQTPLDEWTQPLSEEEANLPLDTNEEDPDCPVITCTRDEHRAANAKLKDVVIFHILGRRVPFGVVNNRIQNIWAAPGQVGSQTWVQAILPLDSTTRMIANELYWRIPGNLGNTTSFHVFGRKVLNQGRTLSHIHSFGFVF